MGFIFTMEHKYKLDAARPKPEVTTWAIDFETYFDSDVSVRKLGNKAYFNHPGFDAYLVTGHSSDGETFCGHPKDFEWGKLTGCRVVSHNASFDENLYLWGRDTQGWESCDYLEWCCTADMCVFFGLPRNLGGASATLYNLEMDKSVRDRMKGKTFESLDKEQQDEFLRYAEEDARICLYLWLDLSPSWPEHEKEISNLNREICRRGIAIDTDALKDNLGALQLKLFDAENSIPWNGEAALLSRKAFNEECRKQKIEPPASLAQDNPLAIEFSKKYRKEFPWITSVQEWRRINALLQKLQAFDRAVLPDGRYYGGILYFGAHTGRFSGSGGNLNLQNLPRGELFGVTMRNLIKADEGKKLVVVDLSQIEVRTLCWLAGDTEMLKEIAEAEDIYETFAVRFKRWETGDKPLKDVNPGLRHAVKQTVLGCGYQASGARYAAMENITLDAGEEAVKTYRSCMPKVVGLWHRYKGDLAIAADIGENFEISLPSGRSLRYGRVKRMKDNTFKDGKNHFKYFVKIVQQGRQSNVSLFGGKLAENASQALARDVFCDTMLRVEKNGWDTIMHVHDEVVVEVEEDKAEEALRDITEIMSTPPSWIPDLPLAAEGKILDCYEK